MVLFKYFKQNMYPSSIEKQNISKEAGISESQVSVWFMHERRKAKQRAKN